MGRTLSLLLVAAPSIWACVCAAFPSPKQAWESADAVFAGEVEEVKSPRFPIKAELAVWKIRIRVREAFKGAQEGQILTLWQGASDCDPRFKKGDRVLLYLSAPDAQGKWHASGCRRGACLDYAADDLLFLRALPASARRARLAGQVSVHENSVTEGWRRIQLLAGMRVKIFADGYAVEATTNADGVYEIYDLPAGNYRVAVDVPRGLRVDFSAISGGRIEHLRAMGTTEPEINLANASGVSVDFDLVADNRIVGYVYDSIGKPAKDVSVRLQPASGAAGRYFQGFTRTEADGSYVLKDMPAGEYVIVANQDGPDRWSPLPRLFYPSAMNRKYAVAVRIGTGEHLAGIDFRYPPQH